MEEDINLLGESLRGLDLGIESKQECFPRSEYCVRFKDTSAFNMLNPNFWGTYFRSTAPGGNSDRLSKLSESKYYENCIIKKEKTPIAKTGAFSSPWKNKRYNSIFFSPPRITNNSIKLQEYHGFLYDSLLSYKNTIANSICYKIDDLFDNTNDKMIDVYHCNDFPCVMVTVPRFNEICGNREASSLYSIVCAYFIALCNHTAVQNGIPIEMVLRSSFGHNSPSVTRTFKSFRINIGIVPNEYCGVIRESLFLLNNLFLLPLINEELKLSILPNDIDRHNRDIALYNNEKNKVDNSFDVEKWEFGEPLFHVLCKIGDAMKKKVSYQITRMNKYVDLLTHFVSDELSIYTYPKNLSGPISELLNYLFYEVIHLSKSKVARAHIIVPEKMYYRKLREFEVSCISSIVNDEVFWNILSEIAKSINGNDYLLETVQSRRLNGIYAKLEQANLNFIRKSSSELSKIDEGHGSDSEGEIDVESPNHTKLHLYTKKVIVSTGMRAINIAQHLSDYSIKKLNMNLVTDTKYMYYETQEALQSSPKLFDFLCNDKCDTKNATVKYIDLNYCSSSGPYAVNLKEINVLPYDVIVLDYTSSQTLKIRQAVELFACKVSLIILVNSGLKHEQIGADMNPYGTVRILTRDSTLLNELFFVAKIAIATEGLPKHFHHIRKAYKRIGAVIRNKNIYSNNFHPNFRHKTFDEQNLMLTIPPSDFENIIKCINDVNYKEKICELFDAQLYNVFINFFNEDALDRLLDSASDICDLAKSNLISDQINCLSFKDLQHLLYLFSTWPDEIYKFIKTYNQNLETVINWSDETIETLSSVEVENIIDEELVDFDDIVSCYEIDSDIVHSILAFYNDCDKPHLLFLEKDFQHIFLILKKERKRAEEWPYLSDEDILQSIYEKNFNNWIPEGFSSSSGD